MQHLRFNTCAVLVLLALAVGLAALPAAAQPFGSWPLFERARTGDYYEIPHSAALNPTGPMTIEGWVSVSDPGSCGNIVGKGWTETWWVGVCNEQLRSYIRGSSAPRTAGRIDAPGGWHHFAVTWDGAQRCHYVDGVQAMCWAEDPGPLPSNTEPVRIGSDVDYTGFPADGAINEIRLWNVARTQEQIRETINEPITAPLPGLVAVWAEGGPDDVVGPHDGVEVGVVPRFNFPAAFGCTTTATQLCVRDQFVINVRWRTASDEGQATVAPLTTFQSGIFWFFNPTNWEVMVKVLNGCPINDHWWVFTAATTNVFYRMEVLDVTGGPQKIYFNYQGPPAPAVTDTQALASCL